MPPTEKGSNDSKEALVRVVHGVRRIHLEPGKAKRVKFDSRRQDFSSWTLDMFQSTRCRIPGDRTDPFLESIDLFQM